MRARIEDAETLRSILPSALSAYIRAEGWHKVERYGKHSDVYQKDGVQELILPGTLALADYASVISDILAILADHEQRNELQIYRDLIVADRDLIRVRAPDAEDNGTINVEAGVDLVYQSRDLLLSAACAAKEPRAAYRAGRIKDASDYINRVSLGQTEQGSFIITLLAPVPPSLDQNSQTNFWPTPIEEPYERRVTRTLADGLAAAKSAAEEVVRGGGIESFRSVIAKGVSANSCEALSTLIDRGNGLDISVTWAKTRPAPEPRRSVVFSKDEAAIFREAARQFRAVEPRPDERLHAYVTKLDRKLEKELGRITLSTFLDGQPVSVSSYLPPALYSEVARAHDKRKAIALRGDLSRQGQRWQLDNARELTIIDEDDPE